MCKILTPANDHIVPAVIISVFGDTPYFMMRDLFIPYKSFDYKSFDYRSFDYRSFDCWCFNLLICNQQ